MSRPGASGPRAGGPAGSSERDAVLHLMQRVAAARAAVHRQRPSAVVEVFVRWTDGLPYELAEAFAATLIVAAVDVVERAHARRERTARRS